MGHDVRNEDFDFADAVIDNTILDELCPATPVCNRNDKFRTIDGSCNNLLNPKYGMSFTPVQRVLPPAYADGFMLPRARKNGKPLPSTR